MKQPSLILSLLALVGVIALLILRFADKPSRPSSNHQQPKPSLIQAGASLKIAFVDIDSFEAHYDYLKAKRAEFEKRQSAAESEMRRSADEYQKTLRELQQKAQTMSETEGKAAEQQLLQMQESLRLKEQSLSDQIAKEQESSNKELKEELDAFLGEYNKDKGYAFILSHSKALGMMLYADPALDITQDVIDGMNARAKDRKVVPTKK